MKILVADDERLVRITLISMIQELYNQNHVIEQAKDGEELYQMVKNDHYDLVFFDINMPKMNGLEALEVCRTFSERTEWCILSGYTDFEYAKRAISLGVKAYLVKPVSITELKQFMDEIIDEKQTEKQNEHIFFENQISQAFSFADTGGLIKDILPDKKQAEYSLYIYFLDIKENRLRKSIYIKLYKALEEYLSTHIREKDNFALFFLQTGELCLLIEGQEYHRLRSFLKIHGEKYCKDGRIVSIYTTNTDFYELYQDKQWMLALGPLHVFQENQCTISLKEISEQPYIMEKRFFCEQIEMLTNFYLTGNYGEGKVLIGEIEKQCDLKECWSQINTVPLYQYLKVTWGTEFEFGDFLMLIAKLKEVFSEGANERRDINEDLVCQIKDYVYKYYMNDVSLTVIGNKFNLTPTYVSKVFREKTGEKYIDFVTAVRMEKAKNLLLSREKKSVKEVAERVGYMSEKHFSKIFRKYFQCNPSEMEIKWN